MCHLYDNEMLIGEQKARAARLRGGLIDAADVEPGGDLF
jgi:hypothetical protein